MKKDTLVVTAFCVAVVLLLTAMVLPIFIDKSTPRPIDVIMQSHNGQWYWIITNANSITPIQTFVTNKDGWVYGVNGQGYYIGKTFTF